ncbi:M16 family metallopeptidase [Parenemella sanctibonifatiensis]|uniref:Insulinase family protein n=1 Tax=Parenemella sanctibonifatiensis TaxID=2016505 RepID=A0A255EIW2_9ACTN|nr:pitrilysin family protein [Parenemella sanctibonifatiensis]OYN90921.1 hypothetical protein CGZ91_05405 [Parenemella sanctibonifatiensis]
MNQLPRPARPSVSAATAYRFPSPDIDQALSNGVRVLVLNVPGQYVAAASLTFDLPLSVEPREAEGVAAILVHCLDEGTEQLPGEAYAEALESHGAAFGAGVTYTSLACHLDVPVPRLGEAMDLFAQAIRTPELAERTVERHRVLRLSSIDQQLANPGYRCGIELRRRSFADDSREARMAGGEPATVANLGRNEVRDFHARWLSPQRATLVLAGDFSDIDALAVAQAAFGDWETPQAGGTELTHLAATPLPGSAVVVDRPEAVQANLRWAGHTINPQHPDWGALSVASHAMGGAFLSRLNKVLREDKGYTYGIHLGLQPLRHGGLVSLGGSFRSEVIGDALATARELLDVGPDGFSATEVSEAVTYLTGVPPLQYATAEGIAGEVLHNLSLGLAPDATSTELDQIRATTAEAASQAYADHVALSTLVLVANADQVAPQLTEHGFQVEVVSAD